MVNVTLESVFVLQTALQPTSDVITQHQLLTAALCRLAQAKSVTVDIFNPACCSSSSRSPTLCCHECSVPPGPERVVGRRAVLSVLPRTAGRLWCCCPGSGHQLVQVTSPQMASGLFGVVLARYAAARRKRRPGVPTEPVPLT